MVREGERLGDLLDRLARRGAALLEPESADEVAAFVSGRLTDDGGFRGRSEASDLYFTLFAVESLVALGRLLPLDTLSRYLEHSRDGLDLVHLSCLARCLARVGANRRRSAEVLRRLVEYRGDNGAFTLERGPGPGSVYACFLARLAHEAWGVDLDDRGAVAACLEAATCPDGGCADRPGLDAGTTTVTAAALLLRRVTGLANEPRSVAWLLDRWSPAGGFLASPRAPLPDLLSTSTAAAALAAVGVPLNGHADGIAGLVESLWRPEGGFAGHPLDPEADCEHTYYALLALGAAAGAGD